MKLSLCSTLIFCSFVMSSVSPAVAAKSADPVRESKDAATRIKAAQKRLAFYKQKAEAAQSSQNERYQRQLEADRKADEEIRRIDELTEKYKQDLAIAEFNKRRSEIALAYTKAKTKRQREAQQKAYQRKIAAESDASKSSN